jgi:serine kinase of HPr protein (carbohydrate metabolism regulator)
MSEATIHAGCVAIGGRGVLIAGASGAGKSDLALRLIDRGADLVSDDYTRLRAEAGRLMAAPPDTIAGKIEVRGVGIIAKPYVRDVPVALLVDLELAPERLPEPARRTVAGVDLPTIGLNALEPSAPIKVEAALLLHGLPSPWPL